MKIDGKEIAKGIFEELKTKVQELQQQNLPAGRQGIIPHLAIILVGDDPASVAYVNQKKKKAEEIGAKATVLNLESRIQNSELLQLIQKLNNDPKVNGIIIQRPLPDHIDSEQVNQATDPKKDVDAFRKDSPYPMPLAAAVIAILESTKTNWKEKQIVVMGKGETGGGPVITMLKNFGIKPVVIDSKTINPQNLTKQAGIIISTIGKQNILKPEMVKNKAILISVGMQKGSDGKLHGDYNEENIKNIASFYTPVPGGVGPVNVAMLLKNLVEAATL